jgi:hypothetical protein
MPAPKRQPVVPTDDWQQLQLYIDWPEQLAYELIRPLVLFGRPPAARAKETGTAARTIRRKADRFDAAGMASLFPGQWESDPETTDRREIPLTLRQLIVDLKAEHPAFRANELATICYVASGRRPSSHTVRRVLTSSLLPSRSGRRYPPFAEIDDPAERRLVIIRLHSEGWNVKSIAAYLETTRRTIYLTLCRWIEEGVRGLDDKPSRPKQPARKVDLQAMTKVRRLQENPVTRSPAGRPRHRAHLPVASLPRRSGPILLPSGELEWS